MNTKEKLKRYQDWLFKCSAYQMALNIINIDKQTVAPSAGAAYRDERSAYLAGELFSLETNEEIVDLLKDLKDDPEVEAEDKRAIELYYKKALDTVCIPKEEFVAFKKLCDESFDAWILAKSKADYSIFEPYLKRVIAVEGDTVEIINDRIYLNGKMLEENYVSTKVTSPHNDNTKWEIPKGYVFVLGDNRSNSRDSRDLGVVSRSDIVGKVIFRYYPFNNLGGLK